MKKLIIYIVLVSLSCINYVGAQERGSYNKDKFQNVNSQLVKLANDIVQDNLEVFHSRLQRLGIFQREDGKLKLIIKPIGEDLLSIEKLEYLNIEVGNGNPRAYNAFIEPTQLLRTINALSSDHLLTYSQIETDNEGPIVMNSETYTNHSSSMGDGSGINIAIIDVGFDSLTEASNAGVIPPIAELTAYSHGNGTMESTSRHGTGCLETVYDHAPGATYFIHKVASTADLQDAIDDCIADNVHIISHSLSWFNTGWNDNEGDAAQAFNDASNAGILCFTSAGNYADYLHEREPGFTDTDADDWHNWTSTDETNSFTVPSGCSFTISLSWSGGPDPINDDYDLFLYDVGGLVDDSQNSFEYESVGTTNNSGSAKTYGVSVWQDGLNSNAFKMFFRSSNCSTTLQYSDATNSMTHPAVSDYSRLVTVGAVHKDNYNIVDGELEDYSSLGPSTNGSIKPDLVGPTSTTTLSYSGPFNGTSCATPNVAGAAACLYSGHLGTPSIQILQLLYRKAEMYLDWDVPGKDNSMGYGGLYLHDFEPNNIYVHSLDGVTSTVPTGGCFPWFSLDDINNLAPDDTIPILLTDDTNTAPSTLNRPMLIRSPGKWVGSRKVE